MDMIRPGQLLQHEHIGVDVEARTIQLFRDEGRPESLIDGLFQEVDGRLLALVDLLAQRPDLVGAEIDKHLVEHPLVFVQSEIHGSLLALEPSSRPYLPRAPVVGQDGILPIPAARLYLS